MSHRLRMRGFTLVELLVVIAIIGILVALLLPAIQAARQAALKNSCRNNVKQLALACQNHNDTFKTFPPLMFTSGAAPASGNPATGQKGYLDAANATNEYTWIVRLLPFIEEDTLYKNISAKSNKFTTSSTGVVVPSTGTNTVNPNTIKINGLLCPSFSGETDNNGIAATNYVALSSTIKGKMAITAPNWTTTPGPPDGMIIPDKLSRGQSMARMADGTSKTAVLCESKEGANNLAGGTTTYNFSWYNPKHVYVYAFAPAGPSPVTASLPAKFADVTATMQTGLNIGPNSTNSSPASYDSTTRSFGNSSDHTGGIVIHGMGDGSVQEVTDAGIDPFVYYAATTTRGGESVAGIGQE